jgi:hypothetical protein
MTPLHRFAHIADVHLGAHREPALRNMEAEAFSTAMDKCIEMQMDFILVCGDLFHVGIPDLGVVDSALAKMMEVRQAGIPIYAIYGSHDYTPTGTSVIDILSTAGALTNISRWNVEGGRLRLKVFTDEKSGARLAGISARRIGLESKYYEILDRNALEELDGFKVFAFHSGITQFRPPSLAEMETVDISLFPKGFQYYAGGHIHQRGEFKAEGYSRVVFPGPLFIGYGRDMEDVARGEKRGLFFVEFDQEVRRVSFVPVEALSGVFRELSVAGLNVAEANRLLASLFEGAELKGKLVALKVYGELAGGRPADLQLAALKSKLTGVGASYVYLNRAGLTTREAQNVALAAQDPAVIERRLFEQETGRVNVSESGLVGRRGIETASELLRVLRHPPRGAEQKKDYERRMIRDGAAILRLGEEVQ